MYYPVFLNLRGKRVLVVGAGKVALRKVKGLLESGAEVTVVGPDIHPDFYDLRVTIEVRPFRPDDIKEQALVFAATNDRAVNRTVGELARARRIPANIADAPEECGFLVPARVRKDNLEVAVSTGGDNPRLAAELRRRLEAVLNEYRGN